MCLTEIQEKQWSDEVISNTCDSWKLYDNIRKVIANHYKEHENSEVINPYVELENTLNILVAEHCVTEEMIDTFAEHSKVHARIFQEQVESEVSEIGIKQ